MGQKIIGHLYFSCVFFLRLFAADFQEARIMSTISNLKTRVRKSLNTHHIVEQLDEE